MSADQWIDCPELIRQPGGELTRCGLPAEIIRTETRNGTSGPVLYLQTGCVLGHILLFPAGLLTS